MLDAALIAQSVAAQYGVLPGAQAELPYPEWALLVSGLMGETPLGRVVAVRLERNPARLREFTPWERRERRRWEAFKAGEAEARARRDPAGYAAEMAALEAGMARAFGAEAGLGNGAV
ncbi:MAG: hypothetical protein PHO10_03080 [Gemmiger sp.]|nr:hypothetical protein [Gemmiger sp.]